MSDHNSCSSKALPTIATVAVPPDNPQKSEICTAEGVPPRGLEPRRVPDLEQRQYWYRDLKYKRVQLVISVIGFVSVIASLYFNARQTSNVAEALRGNLYSKIAVNTQELDRIFIDHARLRPYFYEGKDVSPDDPDHQLIEAVAELKLDIFEFNLLTDRDFERVLPADTDWQSLREGSRAWVEFSFAKSPILCKYLELHKHWYSRQLYEVMRGSKVK